MYDKTKIPNFSNKQKSELNFLHALTNHFHCTIQRCKGKTKWNCWLTIWHQLILILCHHKLCSTFSQSWDVFFFFWKMLFNKETSTDQPLHHLQYKKTCGLMWREISAFLMQSCECWIILKHRQFTEELHIQIVSMNMYTWVVWLFFLRENLTSKWS